MTRAVTNTTQRLAGKVALITGGGGAIGVETAIRLTQEGATVSLTDISADALSTALETVEQQTGKAPLTIQADVTSEADNERIMADTVRQYGRLDFVYLNAGVSYTSTPIFDTTEESYDRVMGINVKSGRSSSLRRSRCGNGDGHGSLRPVRRICIVLHLLTCCTQLFSASSMLGK